VSARRGLTLDAGALIAFERGEERVRLILRRANATNRSITVPAIVVAEAWRGGRRRWLGELLDVAVVEVLTVDLARRTGELLARTGMSSTVDATVAASAAQRGDIVVTSDPGDMQVFADDLQAIRLLAL
jgi:predicted nucleic acid-binding protein